MALKSTEESSAATGSVYYESLILRAVWYFSADVTNLTSSFSHLTNITDMFPVCLLIHFVSFFLNVEQFILLLVSGDFFPLAYSNCQTCERTMVK